MKWLKKQWATNTNFRHAVSVLLVVGLSAAGVPAGIAGAVGPIIAAMGGV
jgi:hypothetical protein